jgi:CMP-2-keto-3-deoxyoctulosonic acid synthetase
VEEHRKHIILTQSGLEEVVDKLKNHFGIYHFKETAVRKFQD